MTLTNRTDPDGWSPGTRRTPRGRRTPGPHARRRRPAAPGAMRAGVRTARDSADRPCSGAPSGRRTGGCTCAPDNRGRRARPAAAVKRAGGGGPPLAMALSLHPLRKMVDELVELARDSATVRCYALAPAGRRDRTERRRWSSSPTLPALQRYTGVLYDALDVGSLRGPSGAGSDAAGGRIRAVRTGAGHRPGPGLPPVRRLGAAGRPRSRPWRPLLVPCSRRSPPRSGGRPALGLVRRARPGARRGDGERARAAPGRDRAVVSHFNKAHKGRLARALAVTRAEPSDCRWAAVARRAGIRVERRGATHLDVIVAA